MSARDRYRVVEENRRVAKAAASEEVEVTRSPGFYDDVPEIDYHADPTSLSVSGAKTLLKAPALFRHQQQHPVFKATFDLGSAAHELVLGVGPGIVQVDADSWRTKAAQEQRDAARVEGKTPLLVEDYRTVQAMAGVLSSHTLAMQLLGDGKPEVSAYAADEATGIMRRCRFDWLGPTILTDYKSAVSAEPWAFAGAVAKYGYHQQAAWYLDLARDLDHPAEAFAFIVQEKTAPYLVEVYDLDAAALERGRVLNRRALERFRDCTESGLWPGYTAREFTTLSLPRWAHYDNDLETA